MRLIDADYILEGLRSFNDRKHGNPHFLNGIETAKEIITNAPTIDAVPVVRCKGCKHWTTSRHGGNCDLLMIGAIDEMEFCSAGAKMDGGK